MPTGRARNRTHAAQALALAATLLLAGCVGGAEEILPWSDDRASGAQGEPTPAVEWAPGNWWSYDAHFTKSNRTYPLALVVYEEHPDAYVIGSNLTAGFFGLPFNGNVTKDHHNPIIAGEEWRLFDFPLEDGKTWEYEFMGYPVKTEAREARIDAPGIPAHRGFKLTASSYGQTVVEYTYSPITKWFTHLALHDPGEGRTVVEVDLTGFGGNYDDAYYVNVPIWTHNAEYPTDLPGDPEEIPVKGDFLRVTALVALQGKVGDFRMTLRDPSGHVAMEGQVLGQGVYLDRETFRTATGTWRLDHRGLGQGELHVEFTGLKAAHPADGAPTPRSPEGADATIDFGSLLAHAAEQSGHEPPAPPVRLLQLS